MQTFRAEETKNGKTRIHSFYSKHERDEFIEADSEHRKILAYNPRLKASKYRDNLTTSGSKKTFKWDKSDKKRHGGY